MNVPDRQDTTGLSETSLLRDTTDALLKNGRDLSGLGLGLGSVRADAVERTGSSGADLEWAKNLSMTISSKDNVSEVSSMYRRRVVMRSEHRSSSELR